MNNKIFAYVRCSTDKQNEARQLDALKELGIDINEIVVEKISGKDFANRIKYQQLKDKLRQGDLLIIHSIDRLSRNYEQIGKEWYDLVKVKGVDLMVLDMPLLNTKNSKNDLTADLIADIVFKLLSYVAQKERENIKTRQKEGIKSAKAKGVKFGRPKAKITDEFKKVYKLYKNKDLTLRQALKTLGLSKRAFYYKGKQLV